MNDAATTVPSLDDASTLARRLNVKVPTIRKWTITTDMPRIRCGRLVRYEYGAVLAWLRARSR